jgi:Domain of unknown function (DUF222)
MATDAGAAGGAVAAGEVDAFLAHRYGATELVGPARAARLAAQLRSNALLIASREADQLALVTEFTTLAEAEAVAELAGTPRVSGSAPDEEVVASAMVGELQVVLGIGQRPAGRLIDLGHRLTTVLPETLAALADGRLDLARVRTLCEATEGLTVRAARGVQDQMLAVCGDTPWGGLSQRSWRDRTARTVARVDADAAARRRKQRQAARAVRSCPTGDGMAELIVDTDATDVAMAEQVLTDLANARDSSDVEGEHVTMDQRRVDAFVDLFRRVRDGRDLSGVPVRRVRELGLVMPVDAFFGDGPAAQDPGEVRGLSGQAWLDAATAREQARVMAETGAASVLLVDRAGVLTRVVRRPKAPPGGWTRTLLTEAVAARLGDLPPLRCGSHAPTVAIAEQVRVRNPRCTAYDCPRRAHRCDLDHDVPWPRGPTEVDNLAPRHRRHHEIKTRGLVKTRLSRDGSVETVMLTGLVITTRPEPLPGYAPGEGRASMAAGNAA